MELTEAIYGRRSTRAFSPEPVTKTVLESLIDAALQAPSARNEQPWEFVIIQNRPLLDQISEASKAHIRAMEKSSLSLHFHTTVGKPDFHIFYHAPALIVISAKPDDWTVENASLAAENLMLAAHAQGLGTCWIGLAQRWLVTPEGRRTIGVSEEFQPVAPIIVGHPAEAMPPISHHPARLRWID
ncbi:MAG TPA: nitroreductase [Candidatus Methylacidiphilales bacterium]|nr:nitroreductase [Candidatus Methylacidiphilales bacterium]